MVITAITDDKAKAEELQKQYMKMQERLAIQGLISATRALIIQEGQELQEWLAGQAETMHSFSSSQLPANLEGGFTGTAAEEAKRVLAELPQPRLISPIF